MEAVTTLECLVAAALNTDANTLGNNSGASYSQKFVFAGKYSFEAYCVNDKDIVISLCEVKDNKSNVLVAHTLTINHNELLAPIYANFLWVDFQTLVKTNKDLSYIDLKDFSINLLNFREDELNDRANAVISQVFKTAVEHEERVGTRNLNNQVHYFDTTEYGPVYLNGDCLEYYIDAIDLLDVSLQESVAKHVDLEHHNNMKSIAILTGADFDTLKYNYLINTKKLLEEVLNIVDADCFNWAIIAKEQLDNKYIDKQQEIFDKLTKPEATNSAKDFEACKKYFNANHVDLDGATLAEELFNWQIKHQVSFDFKQLALLLYTFAYSNHFADADELLADSHVCEVISIAYVEPTLLVK